MTIPLDTPLSDETELYRRVAPRWLILDKNRNCLRLSSAVFTPEEMSVLIEDALRDDGRSRDDLMEAFPGEYVVALTVALVQVCEAGETQQEVRRTPETDEPAHGEVVGKKTRGMKRRWVRECDWLERPTDLCPDE